MGVTEALPPKAGLWLGSPAPGCPASCHKPCTDPWEDVSSELQGGRGKEGEAKERISELLLRMRLADNGGASLTQGHWETRCRGKEASGGEKSRRRESRGDRFREERKERGRDWKGGGERRDGDEQEGSKEERLEEKV